MADRFVKRLVNWYNKKYRIDSMRPSMLIVGPANFPVRKKEKKNRATDRHREEYRKIMGMKERIHKLGTPSNIIKAANDDATEKLRAKIVQLTEKRETLQKNGFRQSPKQGAWQRQLTANARFALRFMLKTSAEQPTPSLINTDTE